MMQAGLNIFTAYLMNEVGHLRQGMGEMGVSKETEGAGFPLIYLSTLIKRILHRAS